MAQRGQLTPGENSADGAGKTAGEISGGGWENCRDNSGRRSGKLPGKNRKTVGKTVGNFTYSIFGLRNFRDSFRGHAFAEVFSDVFADVSADFPNVFPDVSTDSFPEVFAGVARHPFRTYPQYESRSEELQKFTDIPC